MNESPLPPGRYRHFKGKEYEVFGLAHHSETEEPFVIYRPLYNDTGWWIRPYNMFTEIIERDGQQMARFSYVGPMQDAQERLQQEIVLLRGATKASSSFGLLSQCSGLENVCRAIEQVAGADSTVLITGETGIGKELVAQAIHELSPRRDQLLVKTNCAALPKELLPSELFGHEAGAFTGANKRRIGRLELADQGTLFLDEIAEISAETQVLLLRVLQNRQIERVGSNQPLTVNVRIITATNKDLLMECSKGHFRSDLFYRLNVFPIYVPALRERRSDIPRLVEHFLTQLNERMKKTIKRVGSAMLDRLMNYDWPGNVRELENIMERAFIITPGETLHIDPTWLAQAPTSTNIEPVPASTSGTWADQERRIILEALAQANGRIYGEGGAAERLGLKPTTLYSKMRKLQIDRNDGA